MVVAASLVEAGGFIVVPSVELVVRATPVDRWAAADIAADLLTEQAQLAHKADITRDLVMEQVSMVDSPEPVREQDTELVDQVAEDLETKDREEPADWLVDRAEDITTDLETERVSAVAHLPGLVMVPVDRVEDIAVELATKEPSLEVEDWLADKAETDITTNLAMEAGSLMAVLLVVELAEVADQGQGREAAGADTTVEQIKEVMRVRAMERV